MAQWKKVIVQGGNVSDLNNDANYVSVNAIPAFTTASFGGTETYASGSATTQNFSIISGSVNTDPTVGSGLLISASVAERKATFTLHQIPTASLAHTGSYIGKTKVGLGEVVTSISGANFVDITATGSFTGSFIGDGSGLTNLTATRLATGSITASVNADGNIFVVADNSLDPADNNINSFVVDKKQNVLLADNNQPNIINASSSFIMGQGNNEVGTVINPFNGSVVNSGNESLIGGGNNKAFSRGSLVWGRENVVHASSSAYTVALGRGLTSSGSVPFNDIPQTFLGQYNAPRTSSGDLVTIGNGVNDSTRSNLAIFNTASIIFNAPVTGSSFTGSFVGDGSGLTGVASTLVLSGSNAAYAKLSSSVDLKTQFLEITGSGKEVEVTLITGSNGATFQVGLPNNVEIAETLKVGTNLTVEGNLIVNGTASYINTQELFVEDKFIILASGSGTAADAGIIIDRGAYANANVGFGYDAELDRWGWQAGLSDSGSALQLSGSAGNAAFATYTFTDTEHGPMMSLSGEFVKRGALYVSGSNGDLYIYA
jgi:hypothetical protein